MSSKIMINAVDPAECRIAKVKDSKLEEFHIESASREITHSNIYKGIIVRIEPSLQAVFIDYGVERHGFLQKHEIHSDYYLDNDSGNRSITGILKQGQELLVQVTKDLMPGSEGLGVSRKIEDEEERKRLKEIISTIKIPEGFGIIVRTAGIGCTKAQISGDLSYLLRLWKNIKGNVMKVKSPALLYKERNLVVRSIRDYFTPDVNEILIDDPGVHREAKDFIKIISPKHSAIVKLYKEDKPIFTKFQLESQINSIFESRVKLKSGGSIVIEQTEALVAIDVNSGKATQTKSVEQTALATNLEAAEEIARQLRLRDLGGLIVIDFIDMRDSKHNLEVEKNLKTFVKDDKARIKFGKISRFGIMEMSRQRIRPSIEFGSFEPCRHCRGKGVTPSSETQGLSFLRKLNLETLKDEIASVKGVVPVNVADYLLNKKRKEILDLETRRNLTIRIEGNNSMSPGESEIVSEKT
jgi:ribonuclease E